METFILGIISLIILYLTLNILVTIIIFHKIRKVTHLPYPSRSDKKYYWFGIIYIFRIQEMVYYELLTYYKDNLKNMNLNMSIIHKPTGKIRYLKDNINLYNRKIKLEKIKRKVKINKLKRIY
jgi:hypothetical protein